MLTESRKSLLLDRLSQDGKLVAADLARELDTSEDTIRRDLRQLAAEGLLLRVHGGALPLSPTNRPVAVRQRMRQPEKARLAAAAVSLLRPGMTVIVDGGTTHLALVAALPPALSLTLVTHSPAIAAATEDKPRVDTILIGGRMFRHSMVALGPSTLAAYQGLRADLLFLGVTGASSAAGLTTGDPEEAALKAALTLQAAETVVLATDDKLDAASPWHVAPLGAAAVMVASRLPREAPAGLRHVVP